MAHGGTVHGKAASTSTTASRGSQMKRAHAIAINTRAWVCARVNNGSIPNKQPK